MMANNMSDFYDNLDLKYPEIAICVEDTFYGAIGRTKFSIPVLTPNLNQSTISQGVIRQDGSSLVNKNKKAVEIENITVGNYITIPVPSRLVTPNSRGLAIRKDSKWIVIFMGGDINKPQIISEYLE